MCRIASLFLLQRLKGSMSGDACDINNIETRAVIKFFSLQVKAPKEIHAILTETLGEHAPSHATVKNWVAQFKRGDFSTCDAPRPGRPKTVATPEIIYQIHELILEDRRWEPGHLTWAGWVHHSWIFGHAEALREVGPEMPERGEKTSKVPVVWATFGIFLARSKWFPFGRDWWPWTKPGYITMTRRQSNNQWNGGIAAHPAQKIPSAKIRWKSSGLDFLGSRRHPPHWISSKGPNYQRGVLLISTGAIEGHFEGKTPRKGHQGVLVLARQWPGSLGTCIPEETGLPGLPVSWSPTLFSGSGPVRLPPVPWTEKTIESSPLFVRRGGHCCRGELLGRVTFWIILSGFQKLQQRAKKCIELRGEYVE